MNRRILAIIVVVAVAIGGFVIVRRLRAAGNAAGVTQYKVAKVEVGQVKKTVSATGIVQPWKVIDIKSRAGGEVHDLAVEVGDRVTKGQVIARIDPTDTALNASTARADLESAQARQRQSRETYELQRKQSEIGIAQARADLQAVKANRAAAAARLATARTQSTAQPKMTSSAIRQAEASLNQALQQRQALNATNPQQRAAAKAAHDQAVANLKNSRQNVARQESLLQKGFVSQQAVDTAQADVSVREAAVESAKARLDTIDMELAAAVEGADARVAQARAALENARTGAIDITSRRNTVKEQEAALRQMDAQVKRSEVALRQAIANQANNAIRGYDVNVAQASIARAAAQRQNAETILSQTVVRAPSEGVILQKYVEEGTIITSGLSLNAAGTSIVQIGDVTKMYVDVTVDETDIANVDEGMQVDVTMEAYPGVPFEGKVARVDPQAKVEQNVTSVHVRVEIDNSSPTFQLIKPGMNATCEFVIEKKEDVVAVPTEAVREDDQGKFVELAQSPGKPAPPDPKTKEPADPEALIDINAKRVAVEVGVEGNDNIEIVSGVKEGDTVVVQTIEPQAAGPASPFGGGFGGGRPGGNRGGGGGGGRR